MSVSSCAVVARQSPCRNKRIRSSTPESRLPHTTNAATSLPTVHPASTSSAAGLKPFWTEHTKALSTSLWLPTKTDSVVSRSTSYETCLRVRAANSWFSVRKTSPAEKRNSQTTSSPLPTCLWEKEADSTQSNPANSGRPPKKKRRAADAEAADEDVAATEHDVVDEDAPELPAPMMRARKVRIYPTAEERKILRKWMGTARWTYNQCLARVNEGAKKTKKALRALCLNAEAKLEDWVYETPYDVRDEAMNDLLKAFKTCFSKGDKFKMKFRSKWDAVQSIAVLKKHWGHKTGVWSFLPKVKASEKLPDALPCDSRLLIDGLNRWWMCIPSP